MRDDSYKFFDAEHEFKKRIFEPYEAFKEFKTETKKPVLKYFRYFI